jgi:hypothetical protein
MRNKFNDKWRRLFAAKRFDTQDGVITLTPLEQQELLDDSDECFKDSLFFCSKECKDDPEESCKSQCGFCKHIE